MEDLLQTTRTHVLPYRIQMCPNGKVAITNTANMTIFVTRDDVTQQLARIDLDTHRRLMYEAARDEFRKAGE